jgi:hypothetical protein
MTTTKQEPGVLGEAAAPLGVTRWVDASGQALEHFDLDRMPGRFKLIFCFQDACPGCHATGFPALARVVDAFRGSDFVGFAAVQTVFEDFGSNTWERMLANHSRYALGIPFGHDAGDEQDGAGSELMRRYRNGGTPLVHPDRSRWQSGLQPFPNRRRQARHLFSSGWKTNRRHRSLGPTC